MWSTLVLSGWSALSWWRGDAADVAQSLLGLDDIAQVELGRGYPGWSRCRSRAFISRGCWLARGASWLTSLNALRTSSRLVALKDRIVGQHVLEHRPGLDVAELLLVLRSGDLAELLLDELLLLGRPQLRHRRLDEVAGESAHRSWARTRPARRPSQSQARTADPGARRAGRVRKGVRPPPGRRCGPRPASRCRRAPGGAGRPGRPGGRSCGRARPSPSGTCRSRPASPGWDGYG